MTNYRVQFQEKELDVIQTVAELLFYAREEIGATVEEAAQELQISPFYLEALEQGAYGSLPSVVYTRHFVRRYGAWLGLNVKPLLELFEQEWCLFEKHQQSLIDVPKQERVQKQHFWVIPRWIRWAGVSLVVMGIFTYLGHELYALRQPPTLIVDAPGDEVMTQKQVIAISGQTEPEVALSINNQTILSDAEGNFSESVALQPGLNVIEIQAKKKYSKETKVYRKVIVAEQPVITDNSEEQPLS